MVKSEVIDQLKHALVNLEFTKSDGTIREMVATLVEEKLPTQAHLQSARQRSDESLPVWDVQADGWRSFRWDSLISVNGVKYVA